MTSTDLTFASLDAHRAWLASQADLPAGFHIGTTRFEFIPFEVHKPSKMTITLITLDKPTWPVKGRRLNRVNTSVKTRITAADPRILSLSC